MADLPGDPGMPGDRGMPGDPDPTVSDRDLRSALAHAVRMASVAANRRPPEPYPAALRRYASQRTLSAAACAAVRRAVAADPSFRRRLAETASPDLVDDLGRRWLSGRVPPAAQHAAPAGGAPAAGPTASGAATDATPAAADAAGGIGGEVGPSTSEQRRRVAAESSRDRALAELAALREQSGRQIADLERRVADSEAARARLERAAAEAESRAAAATRRAAQHERAAEAARAAERAAVTEAAEAATRLAEAITARDAALADRAERIASGIDIDRLRAALRDAMAALGDAPPARSGRAASTPSRRGRRAAIGMPGGILADSPQGVEHLCRTPGVRVIVDGYNVAKLGWPGQPLHVQRDECIAALESLAARWGTAIVVVFDGDDVPGASTRARRAITVAYSAAGQSADDAIRAMVAGEPAERPLVVVTNDRAIRDDVRAEGANPLTSDALLAAVR